MRSVYDGPMTAPPLPIPAAASDARLPRRVLGVTEILIIAAVLSVFGFAFNAIGLIPFLAAGVIDPLPWSLTDASARAIGYLVGVLGTVAVIAIYLRARLGVGLASIGLSRPRWGAFATGLLLGAAISGLGTAIAWSSDLVRPTQPAEMPGGAALVLVALLYLLTYVLQGAGEEIVSRGFLLRGTAWWIGLWPAVAVQALLFVALHLGNPTMTPLYALFVIVFALFAALLVIIQGHLWGVIGVHGGYNVVFFAVGQRGLGLRDVADPDNLSFPDLASTPFFALGALVLGVILWRRRGGSPTAAN